MMRLLQLLRRHLSSPRRRWQLLVICVILIVLNLTSSMVYQHQQGSSSKPVIITSEKPESNKEPKTVNYHEILPEIISNEETEEEEEDISTTTSGKPTKNKIITKFPSLYNPWFSDHDHQNLSDPLNLQYPQDYDNLTINSCSYRQFKNSSVYGHSEFIHDYVEFKQCMINNQQSNTDLDTWIEANLKTYTGDKGQIVVSSALQFRQNLLNTGCADDRQLVIGIISRSKEERDNIRLTWGKSLPSTTQVVYFIGQDDTNEEEDTVQTEISMDDVHFDFKQTLALLIWVHQTCPRVRYVLKTSSDIFVNVAKVNQLVEQEMYASNRMYGELLRSMGPAWDENDSLTYHHHVPRSMWPWSKFPPFLKGPSYMISGDLIPRMLMVATVIPALPLAQVYFTGLVPLMGHMMRMGVTSFFAYYPPPLNATDPCEFSMFGGIHGMTTLEHMQVALSKNEETIARNNTCEVPPRCLAMVEGKCMMFSKDVSKKKKKRKPAFNWP